MQNISPPQITVATVLTQLETGDDFTTEQVLHLKLVPQLIPALLKKMPELPTRTRRTAFELLMDLGRPVLEETAELPERFAPYVHDPLIVNYLVQALADDDSAIQDRASAVLVHEVPSLLMHNHTSAIIEQIRRIPSLDRAALLLGKTDTEVAYRLLTTNEILREANPEEEIQAALGRLGNRDAEHKVITAYLSAQDPKEKADRAFLLGYMQTIRAVLTLARDIRTSESYVWRMQSRRSMRVHIIEALHQAFLTEPIFWRPFYKPEDDSYYEAIEEWLTRNLGVTWDQPRPEFLYEEDAPILR